MPSTSLRQFVGPILGTIIATLLILTVTPSPLSAQVTIFRSDCNANGVVDGEDVSAGTSQDCNANNIPDECEVTPFRFGFQPDGIAVAPGPRVILGADFDGDGLVDVATGNTARDNSSTISVLRNTGGGTFAASVDYASATRLSALDAVDFDGDDDLDLVSMNSSLVLAYANRGDGTFDTPQEYAVERSTRFVAGADVNGDGAPDLVIAHPTDDTVGTLLNRGDGTFDRPTLWPTAEFPVAVATGDLDGDGYPDVVVAGRDASALAIHANQGDGNLGSAVFLPAEIAPIAVVLDDLDGDGDLDIVSGGSAGLAFWTNTGDGTMLAGPGLVLPSRGLFTADFDEDGDLDLLVPDFNFAQSAVLRNDGNGGFAAPTILGLESESVGAADIDADGDVDILAVAQGADRFHVLANGNPSGIALEPRDYEVFGPPHWIRLGDLDGDGSLDVVTTNGDSGPFTTVLNNGDGTLAPGTVGTFGADPQTFINCDIADVTGDGQADLLLSSRRAGILFLPNQGDGKFSDPSESHGRFLSPERNAWTVEAGDLNGDGLADLVVGFRNSTNLSLFINPGDGQFVDETELPLGDDFVANAFDGFEFADLDLDGDLDIVISSAAVQIIATFHNLGNGVFLAGETIPLPFSVRRATTADLDSDGIPDLATVSGSADVRLGHNAIAILAGDGQGGYSPRPSVALERSAHSVVAGDIDGDGAIDLLATNEASSSISLLLGKGDATFLSPTHWTTPTGPRFSALGDMDGDGDIDIVSANRLGFNVTVFRNDTGGASFGGPFLEKVCTPLDFERVSIPRGDDEIRAGKYLLPARASDDLLPTLFPNSRRFARGQDFLNEVFPERYGELSPDGYSELVERRATRDYFAGSLRAIRIEEGVVYGFDVDTETGVDAELLDVEETRSVLEGLQASFQLTPIVYSPVTAAAQARAESWVDPGFSVIIIEGEPPIEPPLEGNPTFELEVPAGTEICGVFAEAGLDRGPAEELEYKSIVKLHGGILSLETDKERFPAALFDEVRFGPRLELAEPLGPGEFVVQSFPVGAGVTAYRFTHERDYALQSGAQLRVALISPLTFQALGNEVLTPRQSLDEDFFTVLAGEEAILGQIDGRVVVRYGSCRHDRLERVEVDVELAGGPEQGGGQVRILERFLEADSLFATGPASLARAEVQIGEERRDVTAYEHLVYSASRHNTRVTYWIVFEPPLEVDGVGTTSVLEIRAPEVEPERARGAAYLGIDPGGNELTVLAEVAVTAFERRPLPAEPVFRRGDASGDGQVDLTDVVTLLDMVFRRATVPCRAAADSDDNGSVNVADALLLLAHLFRDAAPPPEPYERCGADPNPDALGCLTPPPCP